MKSNVFARVAPLALVLLAACGTDAKKSDAPAQEPSAQEQDQGVNVQTSVDETTAQSLPTMIVAKVPVDAQGNELVEQGEAREAFGPSAASGGDSASAAFEGGAKVSVADELDQDTSGQQWGRSYYWSTPWYPGKLLGRGLWWGRNPYVYYGGSSYGYSYSSSYRHNGCNYYTYYPSYNYPSSYGSYGNY